MRRSSGFFGLLGAGFLLFALVLMVFTSGAGTFDVIVITVHVIAGIACLIVYLSSGVENLRSFLGERSTRYGTSTLLASIFFVGILAGANFLSSRHNARWDMTDSGAFSLSPQTNRVIDGLTQDLVMQAFVERGRNPILEDLLRRYADRSRSVSFRMIDPDRQPELAERYAIRQYNTVRLALGNNSTTVADPSEESITNALIKLTRDSQASVCAVTGHGEPSFEDRESAEGYGLAARALENENYSVESILLPSLESVPDSCAVVVLAGPTRPILENGLRALDQFVRRGGGLFAVLAPRQAPEVVSYLAQWGIAVGDDVIVDQVVRLFQGPSLGLAPLVEDYDSEHEITRELRERTLFPLVRSVSAQDGPGHGIEVTELVRTSESSWAETDVTGVFESGIAAFDPGDRRGPVPIAAAARIDLGELNRPVDGEARIVAIGSVEFANNQNLEGTFFNRDLFLNSVGWLAGQSDLLSIRPRAVRASRVSFTRDEGTLIFYLSVLVIPETLLLLGMYVWWRRR